MKIENPVQHSKQWSKEFDNITSEGKDGEIAENVLENVKRFP